MKRRTSTGPLPALICTHEEVIQARKARARLLADVLDAGAQQAPSKQRSAASRSASRRATPFCRATAITLPYPSRAPLAAAERARMALTYRSERERARQVVQELERRGGEALALERDLGSVERVKATVAATVARFGQIDVLLNNAVRGSERQIWEAPPFKDISLAEWRGVIHNNIDGAFAAIQTAVPSMRAQMGADR